MNITKKFVSQFAKLGAFSPSSNGIWPMQWRGLASAKLYKKVKQYRGPPSDENIQMFTEDLPKLGDGDVLFEAKYLSVDPYMRTKMMSYPEGSVMIGEQVARVVESRHPQYPENSMYVLNSGWRSHTATNPDHTDQTIRPLHPGLDGLPDSLALGTVGMPGATAYNALVKFLNVQPKKNILIPSASGAVGQVACQIAEIKGLTVIACAGSQQKCDYVRSLGADVVFNYKTDDLAKTLAEVAPQGIDYYLDSIGGDFSVNIINKYMRKDGKCLLIGNTSEHNLEQPAVGELPWNAIKVKTLTIQGMQIFDLPIKDWNEAFDHISLWIKEGELSYKEHVTQGFDNMRKAFYELYTGENFGKAIVEV